ncbi:MAG: gamma-glutamyltransferase family protein [Gemmatimonadales bacterium]
MANRRKFLTQAGRGVAAAAAGGTIRVSAAEAQAPSQDESRQGPKDVVRGKKAVAASQHPIVTRTILDVLRSGGNAIDAAVAGCVVQATVQPEMTNHTGTVTMVYWDAKSRQAHQLISMGTLVDRLPPFRTWPANLGGFAVGAGPVACIPGFMPGMKAMLERFGTKRWSELIEPAIRWAEEGHIINSFQLMVLEYSFASSVYFPSGRKFFTPSGFQFAVGDRWRNPELAAALRRSASEGPDYFITGEWARKFIAEANRMGWAIKLDDMTATKPRWGEPLRWKHRDHEVLQLAPPERQGVYTALVLGILRELNVKSMGHYTESAEALFYLSHALRRAHQESGYLNDPAIFGDATRTWLSEDYHRHIAQIFRAARPKVDLSRHVQLTSAGPHLVAAGLPTAGSGNADQPAGSCESVIVDEQGNWVQIMNTLQSGGIPGIVIDGIPMVGSHVNFTMDAAIGGWLAPGARMRSIIGNTIVLKDGKPVLSMGTPGNVHCTIPQVLSNCLDYGMEPNRAAEAPRMLPLRDDYVLEIESRIPDKVGADLMKMGVRIKPLPTYDYHMGSFQMAWRDAATGLLNASADPRRAGMAGGL